VRPGLCPPLRRITSLHQTSPALTGVALGGILVAYFAVLLLLLVPCYLKRRRRRLQSTRVNDVENDLSRQASFGSGNHKTVSLPISPDCRGL
jgi:hypothetical protein